MQIVATNLCLWINIIIEETVHELHLSTSDDTTAGNDTSGNASVYSAVTFDSASNGHAAPTRRLLAGETDRLSRNDRVYCRHHSVSRGKLPHYLRILGEQRVASSIQPIQELLAHIQPIQELLAHMSFRPVVCFGGRDELLVPAGCSGASRPVPIRPDDRVLFIVCLREGYELLVPAVCPGATRSVSVHPDDRVMFIVF